MGAIKALWEETRLRKEEEDYLRYVSEYKSMKLEQENKKDEKLPDATFGQIVRHGLQILFSIFLGDQKYEQKKEQQKKDHK